MVIVHDVSPVFLDLGFFQIYWYGVMYMLGFLAAFIFCYRRRQRLGWQRDDLDDALFYCVLGVLIGGRLGYALFYNLAGVLAEPLSVFYIWEGGMSFHGGVLGVTLALILLARRKRINLFDLSDFILVPVPIGIALGRLGNYINGELWGMPTSGTWGVIFPAADLLPRHPSQLYEMLLEGWLLFFLLWWFSHKPKPRMMVTGLFLAGYGCARFMVEFVRVPDSHLGYLLFNWMTMGQLLSLPLLVAGVVMLQLGLQRQIIPNYASKPEE